MKALLVLLLLYPELHAQCTDWNALGPPVAHELRPDAVAEWNDHLLAYQSGQLHMYSISLEGLTELLHAFEAPYAEQMLVSQSMLLTWHNEQLAAYRLAEGSAPSPAFSLELDDEGIEGAAWIDPYLYVGIRFSCYWGCNHATAVFDCSNTETPTRLGTIEAYRVAEWNGMLVMAGASLHLGRVIDPSSPQILASIQLENETYMPAAALDCSGDRAAVMVQDGGPVHLVDLSDLAQLRSIGSGYLPWGGWTDTDNVYDMRLLNDEILVANLFNGFQALAPDPASGLVQCQDLWADVNNYAVSLAIAANRIWLCSPADSLHSLPLFPANVSLNLRIRPAGQNLRLDWVDNGAAEWSVYRSGSAGFNGEEEYLGTTLETFWMDARQSSEATAFYQVRMGRPEDRH